MQMYTKYTAPFRACANANNAQTMSKSAQIADKMQYQIDTLNAESMSKAIQ